MAYTQAGFIDIHCHIVFGVDDGARDLKDSVNIVKMAYNQGIREMIATPHFETGVYEDNQKEIHENFETLKKALEARAIKVKLHLGNEIYYSYGVVDNLEKGKINTLAGTRYVLVEFSPADGFKYIKESLYELVSAGYIPILAHAERFPEVIKYEDRVKALIEEGSYIQINAHTIAGGSGMMMRRRIIKYIQKGLVHFVGTDAHSTGRRSPDISGCLSWLRKKTDDETIRRIMIENQKKVIAGEYI